MDGEGGVVGKGVRGVEGKHNIPNVPICCNTRGSIILAICWFSFAIWEGFTFLFRSPPNAHHEMTSSMYTYKEHNLHCYDAKLQEVHTPCDLKEICTMERNRLLISHALDTAYIK